MGSTALAIVEDKVPAHIAANMDAGRGNEHVGAELKTPKVKLLQKMSNEVDKHHTDFVPDADVGLWFNDLTKEVYTDTLHIISLSFTTDYTVKQKEEFGKNFIGTFVTLPEARKAIAEAPVPAQYEYYQTHNHVVVLKNAKTGALEGPVIMEFRGTKLKISKAWNSEIAMKGGDRFACLWKIIAIPQSNDKGSWHGIDLSYAGWTKEEDFKVAEAHYELHK